MKTVVLAVLIFISAAPAFAADNTNTNPNYDQAHEDYRIYLQELKKLGAQYREITGEMKKVIAEEGLPAWSEADDSFTVVKPGFPVTSVAAGAEVKESKKDITVKLDLPGLDRGTLKVSIEDQKTLRVYGKRKDNGEAIERLVTLPVAAEGAEGKYEDGVLTVKAKKSEETKKEVVVPVS